MALGRQGERQSELLVTWREMPRSPGHVFYDRLQAVLIEADFDVFAEETCKPYYGAKMGAPSIPPGRYIPDVTRHIRDTASSRQCPARRARRES
jgi:transposase